MSSPPLPDLDALSADGLKRLVARLLARVAALEEENRRLREENARLEKLPKRPRLAPGGMDRAAGARRRRRTGRGGGRTPPATEERVLTVAAPPGSRRKGYQPYTVQDLVLSSRVVRYRRERWLTPDGRELVAPLPPEVAGHFGPGVVRYVLMQHVQGQVTVEARGQKPRASYGKWAKPLTEGHGKTQCFRHFSVSLRPRSGDAAPACPGFLTRCPDAFGHGESWCSRRGRRPDVRFRGVEAAVEQRARAGRAGGRRAGCAGTAASVRHGRQPSTARRCPATVRAVLPSTTAVRLLVYTAASRGSSDERRLTPIALMWGVMGSRGLPWVVLVDAGRARAGLGAELLLAPGVGA